MKPSDLSFGASFDVEGFRSAIRSTMQMGMPNAIEERATFIWPATATFNKANKAGRPFNFNEQASSVDPQKELQVDCAYEFVERASHGTPLGQFENPRVKLYLMDVDYEKIVGAVKARLGGNMYTINFIEPPVSLFVFTLYTLHLTADDEA